MELSAILASEDKDWTVLQIQTKLSSVFNKEYSLDEIEQGLEDFNKLTNKIKEDEELLIYPDQFVEGI